MKFHRLRLLAVLIVSCAFPCLAQETRESWLWRFPVPGTVQIASGYDAGPNPLEGISNPLPEQTLAGVVDLHAHCVPDSVPRSIGAIDLARLAYDRGMRALVLKNHSDPTASWAYLVRKEVLGMWNCAQPHGGRSQPRRGGARDGSQMRLGPGGLDADQ